MKSLLACVVVFGGAAIAAGSAQAQPAPSAAADVYHVHFTKAVPGQAAALGKALSVPDKTSPMPEHFVVLRHQEGDDWDYVVIQHMGPKAEVTAAAPGGPDPARDLRAWHADSFVSGPPWAEFTRQMGIGGSAAAGAPSTSSVFSGPSPVIVSSSPSRSPRSIRQPRSPPATCS